jgi:hypothetical protein
MAMRPHAGLGNYTRTAEYGVEWVTGVIRFASERGLTRIEAKASPHGPTMFWLWARVSR